MTAPQGRVASSLLIGAASHVDTRGVICQYLAYSLTNIVVLCIKLALTFSTTFWIGKGEKWKTASDTTLLQQKLSLHQWERGKVAKEMEKGNGYPCMHVRVCYWFSSSRPLCRKKYWRLCKLGIDHRVELTLINHLECAAVVHDEPSHQRLANRWT